VHYHAPFEESRSHLAEQGGRVHDSMLRRTNVRGIR